MLRFVNKPMATVKEQLKPIILSSLRITDMTPADLRDDQPLLGGELEIDSIDILQLVLEIERHFNIKLVQGNFNQKNLESVNALAAVIEGKEDVHAAEFLYVAALDRIEENHLIAAVIDGLGLRAQACGIVAAALDRAGAADRGARIIL